MKVSSVPPTGQPQPFEVHESFFSTTDRRGVITAGNRIFARVSGYDFAELIGSPHNIIRHPGMPRCVFRLLWDTAAAGRPFMGYVKNQARNGNHYWVFAVIVPAAEGYLSVRIKPTTPLLAAVESLYRDLLADEEAVLGGGGSESAAAEASLPRLQKEIRGLGHASYEAFGHHALNAEIRSRDEHVARLGLRLFPDKLATDNHPGFPALGRLHRDTCAAYANLSALFPLLESLVAAGAGIRRRKDAVLRVAEDFRLGALNAQIASVPLGDAGRVTGTIASFLNGHARTLAESVDSLSSYIAEISADVEAVASGLSSARIQMEIALEFLGEIAESRDDVRPLVAKSSDLRECFSATLDTAFAALDDLRVQTKRIRVIREKLRKDVVYLRIAQLLGRTEAVRLPDAENLRILFEGFRRQIADAGEEIESLGETSDRMAAIADGAPPLIASLRQSIAAARMDAQPAA